MSMVRLTKLIPKLVTLPIITIIYHSAKLYFSLLSQHVFVTEVTYTSTLVNILSKVRVACLHKHRQCNSVPEKNNDFVQV